MDSEDKEDKMVMQISLVFYIRSVRGMFGVEEKGNQARQLIE